MRGQFAAVILVLFFAFSQPAGACDDWYGCWYDDWSWFDPGYVESEPVWWDPAPIYEYEPDPWWHEPAPFYDPAPSIEPAAMPAYEIPPGIYYVTETYVADVITSVGATTTYSTATVSESTGSYARVLDTVGTGAASVYDGAAFNGRSAMSDGRAVAGTYYENFVLTDNGFIPVSVVFFQDDALTRAAAPPPPTPVGLADPAPAPTHTVSVSPIVERPAAPMAPVAPQAPEPPAQPRSVDVVPPEPAPIPAPPPPAPVAAPRPEVTRFVITPTPDGDGVTSIEVLRGREVRLWLRAWSGTQPAAVVSWRLASGDLMGPTSGTGAGPIVTRWDRLAAPGSSWPLRFVADVALGASGLRSATVSLDVIVRSPALVE